MATNPKVSVSSPKSLPIFKEATVNNVMWYNTSNFPTKLTDEEEMIILLIRGLKVKGSANVVLEILTAQEEGEETYYEFLKECATHKPTFTKNARALIIGTSLEDLVVKAQRDVKTIKSKEGLMKAMKTLYAVFLKLQ